tara:strand:- start:7138 stop:9363 length:2226 start_codon:yes stop_codon:yes gene_type:complete
MIAIAIGFVLAGWQPHLISLVVCACLACITLLCFKFISWHYKGLMLCFVGGFIYATLWGHWQVSHKLSDEFVRTDWRVTGVITGLPRTEKGVTHFNFEVASIEALSDIEISDLSVRKLKLSWYKPSQILKPGHKLRIDVRLKPPHGLVNPNGFDYERWLLVRGFDATGYVRSLEITGVSSFSVIDNLRDLINLNIESRYENPKAYALLQALITGYKKNLSDESWEILRRSGTVHLAVISGLHIGFMAVLGWWIGRIISFLLPRTVAYLPYVLSMMLAGFYMLLAGAEIPTQRAFIMIAVFVSSAMMRWFVDHWTRWWVALVCVLALSPLAAFEVGLWLSFGAVALLIWFSQLSITWYSVFKLQLALLAGMLPLYLFFFSGASTVGPVINLIAIPLVSVLVVVSFINLILTSIDLYWLAYIEQTIVRLFWWMVENAASWEWAFIDIQYQTILSLCLVVVACVILISPKGWIPKPLAFIFLLPLVFNKFENSRLDQEFDVIVFDVGQGLAVLVEVGEYRLLYDTGASYKSGSSAFERSLLPYFQSKGIKQLDHLILSHDDNDHVGGYSVLTKNTAVKEVYRSFGRVDESNKYCRRGDIWHVGSTRFEFLAGSEGIEDNDRSCVLLVSNKQCAVLLPGDISKRVEKRISIDQNLNIDWLVASHHGSRTSTSDAILKGFRPKHVIFSAGYGNSFNHPHPEVVKRVYKSGAQAYFTATDGAVFLKSRKENRCIAESMRHEEIRFWR